MKKAFRKRRFQGVFAEQGIKDNRRIVGIVLKYLPKEKSHE